jgi:hypothetical protein
MAIGSLLMPLCNSSVSTPGFVPTMYTAVCFLISSSCRPDFVAPLLVYVPIGLQIPQLHSTKFELRKRRPKGNLRAEAVAIRRLHDHHPTNSCIYSLLEPAHGILSTFLFADIGCVLTGITFMPEHCKDLPFLVHAHQWRYYLLTRPSL